MIIIRNMIFIMNIFKISHTTTIINSLLTISFIFNIFIVDIMIIHITVIIFLIITLLTDMIIMMMKLRELEEGRALEQGSGILPGLRAMVTRAEVTLIWITLVVDRILLVIMMVLVTKPRLRPIVTRAGVSADYSEGSKLLSF